MMDASEKLTLFLEKNAEEYILNWRKKSVVSEDDPYREEVIRNGTQMFKLVKMALIEPFKDEEMKQLAYKLARERVEANVNISEFVYNVNIGKSEIIRWVGNSGIDLHDLRPLFEKINTLFDEFSYHTVRKYTEIKEQQLQEKNSYIHQTHKERLTILGQMSSSFVHEFRNPLTAIIGFTKLLQNDYPHLPYLDIMQHELDQLNYRISQFLHVSRKDLIESRKEEVNLSFLLQELTEFLYPSLLSGDVTLELDADPTLTVNGNKDELRQVFLNLILNSIDALQQKKDLRLIKVECKAVQHAIELKIINNGPKITEDVIHAIFEPFFTTKDLGTGIGLYICKKLIEKHDGEIYCHSTEEQTSFVLKVPVFVKV
ncbi:histidine kinase N-terminal domain-containing protein [Sutcliffiella sp. NPDC057660]|uniref:histidine kinase N-terminal domain-containing protein n=1 Tax=Sutcliffiella sp. NPDC057660 TaxID=3346199 RepID=UPI0036CA4D1B